MAENENPEDLTLGDVFERLRWLETEVTALMRSAQKGHIHSVPAPVWTSLQEGAGTPGVVPGLPMPEGEQELPEMGHQELRGDRPHYGMAPCWEQPGTQAWHLGCAFGHPLRFLRSRGPIRWRYPSAPQEGE